jgi:hypothetical protein
MSHMTWSVDNRVKALLHDSLHLVANLIEQVPTLDPSTLKGLLFSVHKLTDLLRAEALF